METSKEVPVISKEEFKKDLKNRLTTIEVYRLKGVLNRMLSEGCTESSSTKRGFYSEDKIREILNENNSNFEAVKRFKSINRAIKSGLVSPFGELYPKRPFNNRKNTCRRKNADSRETNTLKKTIYGKLKYKGRI